MKDCDITSNEPCEIKTMTLEEIKNEDFQNFICSDINKKILELVGEDYNSVHGDVTLVRYGEQQYVRILTIEIITNDSELKIHLLEKGSPEHLEPTYLINNQWIY